MRFRFSIPGAAVTTDEYEIWFERGVTDGLPVLPPTGEWVTRMLAGTTRSAGELLGEMPPNYGRVTVEKAGINAVMAGCRPEYLPVLIAGVEAACDPAFNLHGVTTSTQLLGRWSSSTAPSPRPLHLLHRGARGGESLAAVPRGAQPQAGAQHGNPLRRLGAPRDLRPREPDLPTARWLSRLVDGGTLEQ